MHSPLPSTAPVAGLPEVVDFAGILADEAAERGRHWFRRRMAVETKSDHSPVTIADREIESLIRGRIAERFPDHGVLGEEHGRERMEARHVWVVDPIDGTRSFVTGWPIWGTLLALLEDGDPRLGIIEMPYLRERWTGVRGAATRFRDASGGETACRTSGCRRLSEARFYTTSLFYFSEADRDRVEGIARLAETPRFGGDCYSYGLLASGHVDLVVEALLQPFDYYALIPVIEGAGGVITDWSGRSLSLESDGRVVAAATPDLHAEALARLAGADAHARR